MTATRTARSVEWWRDAVVYQVYIRSFADGDGDGIGDIPGLRGRLPYLAELGVDALWINPWYPSPMADAGYDVSDYRAVEPVFGTMADAEALLADAHDLGLRVLLDIVPNHASDQHEWFRRALAAPPGSRDRARFVFRTGRGDAPPNDWQSRFGGPAWTRVADAADGTSQWYLHLFAPGQPDFDWTDPDVAADFEQTLRFWFDRGVDGFRIDVAHGLAKVAGLPDVGELDWPPLPDQAPHPHWDVDAVHDVYRSWRAIADSYPDPKVFVAEAWVPQGVRLANYVRGDELHTAFNFDFLLAPWSAPDLRATIDASIAALTAVGAPVTWVLSNHDGMREVSRYARPQGRRQLRHLDDALGLPIDTPLGLRRARAAALLMLALPGGAYVYQGGELGLPEVEDLPVDVLQDPMYEQSGRTSRGRDGCRVPIPWSGERPPFGFGPRAGQPWLPQPAGWARLSVAAEDADPSSTLSLYRAALRLRREHAALGAGTLRWRSSDEQVLAFERDPGFGFLANLGTTPVALPDDARVLLSSEPLDDAGAVPGDVAVWYETSATDRR